MKMLLLVILLAFKESSAGFQSRSFSFCSTYPTPTKWRKNKEFEVHSWIKSITPILPQKDGNDFVAIFTSNKSSLGVNNILSNDEMQWIAFGDKKLDGWLYGRLDAQKKFIPKNTYYLFPDFKTALVGTFNGDKLIAGVQTKATHYRCKGGMLELKFAKPESNARVRFSVTRSHTVISDFLDERDPLERKNIYISKSINIDGIGDQDALIARRDIPPFSLVAYYNGIWEDYSEPYFYPNATEEERMIKSKNLLQFNNTHNIDIPTRMADIKIYRASLGHKSNHHFLLDNVKFCFVKHPIFGEIRGLESTKYIKRGEEIHVQYGYDLTDKETPKWYKDMHSKLFP